jgi:integrase
VAQGWVAESPIVHIKAEGKRNYGGKGHTRLRHKEIRALVAHCEALSPENERAVAVILTLLLGMRAGEVVSRQVRDLDPVEWTLTIDREHAKTLSSARIIEVPEMLRGHLEHLTRGKEDDQYIFGGDRPHDVGWVRNSVRMMCEGAKLPVETAHGLRGAHTDLARAAGATAQMVAAQVGHGSTSITEQSYTKKETIRNATARKAMKVLQGGKGGD